jgi:methionine sulfoxide reductase heme-binding subunit
VRLSGRVIVASGALMGIAAIAATGQITPATSEYQAQLRVWLAARATGITAYLILSFVVSLGLILSHPVNQSTWKLSKRLFPWHENLFVFVVAFVLVHIVALVLDPYAGVGISGAIVPGLSSYRTVPVALGNVALYALLIAAVTARYTKLLPPGVWLKLHRGSIVVWAMAWAHGILAGTDTGFLGPMYIATGLLMLAATAYRYWVGRRRRPTFSSSLPDLRPSMARAAAPIVEAPIAPSAAARSAATRPAAVQAAAEVRPEPRWPEPTEPPWPEPTEPRWPEPGQAGWPAPIQMPSTPWPRSGGDPVSETLR